MINVEWIQNATIPGACDAVGRAGRAFEHALVTCIDSHPDPASLPSVTRFLSGLKGKDRRVGGDAVREALTPWMEASGCGLGLGDGDGLNVATTDRALIAHIRDWTAR